jgi:hypothetical protein
LDIEMMQCKKSNNNEIDDINGSITNMNCVHSPSNGSKVSKWDADDESQTTTDQTTDSGRSRSLTGHTTRLEVKSSEVSETEDENSRPIPSKKEEKWHAAVRNEVHQK